MSTASFNTLTAARDLEAAGIERRQAEAIAGTVRQATAAVSGAATTPAMAYTISSPAYLTKSNLNGAQVVVHIGYRYLEHSGHQDKHVYPPGRSSRGEPLGQQRSMDQ